MKETEVTELIGGTSTGDNVFISSSNSHNCAVRLDGKGLGINAWY